MSSVAATMVGMSQAQTQNQLAATFMKQNADATAALAAMLEQNADYAAAVAKAPTAPGVGGKVDITA